MGKGLFWNSLFGQDFKIDCDNNIFLTLNYRTFSTPVVIRFSQRSMTCTGKSDPEGCKSARTQWRKHSTPPRSLKMYAFIAERNMRYAFLKIFSTASRGMLWELFRKIAVPQGSFQLENMSCSSIIFQLGKKLVRHYSHGEMSCSATIPLRCSSSLYRNRAVPQGILRNRKALQ